MRQRFLQLVCVLAAASLSAGHLFAQSSARGNTAPRGQKWTAPRTPDGKPDLQGIWDFRTVTPMERPAEFANKPVLTEQEAAAYDRGSFNPKPAPKREGSALPPAQAPAESRLGGRQ